jgi:hypothetical protein
MESVGYARRENLHIDGKLRNGMAWLVLKSSGSKKRRVVGSCKRDLEQLLGF